MRRVFPTADTRPGAWDPIARRADMELDNLRAEIVYPGAFGLQFWYAADSEYRLACMQVYNDWLSEFCSAMPDRLLGAGLLPMGGQIGWTIREAEPGWLTSSIIGRSGGSS